MKARTAIFSSLVMVILLTSTAWGIDVVPHQLNVQGVLRNVAGEVVTGSYDIKIGLYATQTGGSPLYTETTTGYSVVGGVFDIYLGPMANIFKNTSAMYLGIQVKASSDSTWDAEMPRVAVTSVGYAFQAEHAEQADELLGAATDVSCDSSPCIGQAEVTFPWALGVSAGGDAAGLTCSGCVGTTDINAKAVVRAKIGDHAVGSTQLGTGSVLNSKLAANAVTTDKIKDGTITTADLANGAVTSAKIANGAIGAAQLGVNYADSASKGGPANGLECSGCVSGGGASGDIGAATITAYNIANNAIGNAQLAPDSVTSSNIVDGTITGNDIANATIAGGKLINGTIGNNQLGINYAGSTSKGGPASDLTCQSGPCVSSGEVSFNYAGSASKGGDATKALDLACSGCVDATEVSFNYAGSTSAGGPATGLSCTGCVDTTKLANGAVTKAKMGDSGCTSGQMLQWNGSSWVCANVSTSSYEGGWGITVSGNTITATQSDLDGRYLVKTADWPLSHGKVINFVNADGTAALGEASGDGANNVNISMNFGGSAPAANEQFSIYDLHSSKTAHTFKADGTAYHLGNLTIGGNYYGNGSHLTNVNADKLDGHDSSEFVRTNCTGCVSSQMIADGTVAHADMANNAIANANIQAGAVTKDKLGASGCSNGQILKLVNGAWACAADDNAGNYTGGWGITISGSTISAKTADLDARYVNEGQANSITSAMIKDGEVAHADMAGDAIYSGNIKDGQVAHADLAANSVYSGNIQDGQVTNADLAANSVLTGNIKDGEVHTADLAGSAVTTAKLANGSVTRAKIAADGCSNGQILKLSSGSWVCASDASGVTGTGSTNYLPVWTGGTTLSNSVLSQDSSNVTIHSRGLVVGNGIHASGTIRSDSGFYVDGNRVIDNNGGWHRSYGQTGWYNGTYGGGWYMTDTSWIRAYGNKGVYVAGEMRATTVRANTNLCIGSSCRTNWGHIDGDNLGNHTATTTLNMNGHTISNVPYINITSGNGHGVRFWSSDSYKISMGNSSEYKYGGVTDYSIKMNMSNTAGRGWTWGVNGQTPVASINTAGALYAHSLHGDGSGVTNVNASKLQGHPASDFTTCSNSCIIHNQYSSAQSANLWISGNAKALWFYTSNNGAGMYSNELWADWINYRNRTGGLRVGNGHGTYGTVYAQNWIDASGTNCVMDPGGATSLNTLAANNGQINNLQTSYQYIHGDLRIGNGLYIGANGSNRGIWLGSDNFIAPTHNNWSYVGMWGQWWNYTAFTRMYSYGFVTISDKNLKYDIRDVDDQDLTWALNSIRKAEIGFYWYKNEHKVATPEEKKYHLATYRPYPHLGAMAQSLPDVVKEPGENVINLGDMIGLSYTAIRALDRNNQRLKAKVTQLQGKVDYLTRILVARGVVTQDQLDEMNDLNTPTVNQ